MSSFSATKVAKEEKSGRADQEKSGRPDQDQHFFGGQGENLFGTIDSDRRNDADDHFDYLQRWWNDHQYLPRVNVEEHRFILVSDPSLDEPFKKAIRDYFELCEKQQLAFFVHFEGFSQVCFLKATSALNLTSQLDGSVSSRCHGLIVHMTCTPIRELVNCVLGNKKILKLCWGCQPYFSQIMLQNVLDVQKAFSIDEECLASWKRGQVPDLKNPFSLSNVRYGTGLVLQIEQVVREVRPARGCAEAYSQTLESVDLEELHILKFRHTKKDLPTWKKKIEADSDYRMRQDAQAYFWEAATQKEIDDQMEEWKVKKKDDTKEIERPERMYCFVTVDPRNPKLKLRGEPKKSPGAWWCLHKSHWSRSDAASSPDSFKRMIQELVATVKKTRCDGSEDPRNLVELKDCVIVSGNPFDLPTGNLRPGDIECHYKLQFDKTESKWEFLEVKERWPGAASEDLPTDPELCSNMRRKPRSKSPRRRSPQQPVRQRRDQKGSSPQPDSLIRGGQPGWHGHQDPHIDMFQAQADGMHPQACLQANEMQALHPLLQRAFWLQMEAQELWTQASLTQLPCEQELCAGAARCAEAHAYSLVELLEMQQAASVQPMGEDSHANPSRTDEPDQLHLEQIPMPEDTPLSQVKLKVSFEGNEKSKDCNLPDATEPAKEVWKCLKQHLGEIAKEFGQDIEHLDLQYKDPGGWVDLSEAGMKIFHQHAMRAEVEVLEFRLEREDQM